MKFDFSSQTVIVTGAGGGIGGATAELLYSFGANVVAVDFAQEKLDALADRIAPGDDRLLLIKSDVASEADAAAMAQATQDRFHTIDGLVAAAGILRTGAQPRPMADTGFDEWSQIININLTGIFLSNRAVLPAMTAQGKGDIVNISSTSGRQGRAFDGPYSASKFGIVGLSESLAEEVQRQGIRVQTVLPDAVDTPLWDQNGTVALKPRDMLPPELVAAYILYLMALPRDMFVLNSVLHPLRSRTRRKKPS